MSIHDLIQEEELRKRAQKQKQREKVQEEVQKDKDEKQNALSAAGEGEKETKKDEDLDENFKFVSKNKIGYSGIREVVLILDESGSMLDFADSFIAGYNDFLTSLELNGKIVYVSTATFNQSVKMHVVRGSIEEARKIPYNPTGMTCLYDAIGKTVETVSDSHLKLSNDNKPEEVICAIITDGLENYSVDYSLGQIQSMVEFHKNVNNWKFIFLGASKELCEQAEEMGIDATSSFEFSVNSDIGENVFGLLGELLKIDNKPNEELDNSIKMPQTINKRR